MEKFTLLILCSSFYLIRANDCTPNMAPCSDVHDIATITCGAAEAECEIKCGLTEDDCIGGLLDGLILGEDGDKIKTIDAGLCKEMCRQQATAAAGDPACEFYRWEEKDDRCILQTNCGQQDMRCQSIDEPRCITGQIGCTEEGATACHLDSPVAYDPVKFHLICHGDLHSTHPEDVNIYSHEEIVEIPSGTECYTIHMCDKWDQAPDDALYYRQLAVFCDEDGTWKAKDKSDPAGGTPTGNEALSNAMINGETLEEPTCESECEPLTLNPAYITQQGTELICDKALSGGPPPNVLQDGTSCILICDNHLSKSISCQFEPDGTKKWKDEDRKEVTIDNVKC